MLDQPSIPYRGGQPMPGCQVLMDALLFPLATEQRTTAWAAAEWVSFLTMAGAALLVLLVKTCFSRMSLESRCEQIRCLGTTCTRKVKEGVEEDGERKYEQLHS